jgi:hypothetical protein
MGYVAELATQVEARSRHAAQLEATAERERLAGAVHDSVLQVLALVQRRGAEIGGPAAELGRLAGEQEAALRALVAADVATRHPWQSGNDAAAAALTDSPTVAKAALAGYRSGLDVSALTAHVQSTDDSGDVTFSVSTTIRSGSLKGTWAYQSQLSVYAAGTSPLIQWQPQILAPNLGPGMSLSVQAVAPSAGDVTDAKGNPLSAETDPGLAKIASILAGNAPTGQGTPGLDVVYTDANGDQDPDANPIAVSQPTGSNTATTIDPTVQNAAMAAVAMQPQSSIVVIQPSTGYILAIANNDGDDDDALTAQIAPGSTMKVVTSTALLNQGMTMNTDVACPSAYTVTGVTFHNSAGESEPSGTPLIDDFAASCNNAFTTQYRQLGGGTLASTARTYFGLGVPWDIGLGQSATYFTIPPDAEDSELAAESFGQGVIQTNPLAMASVAATVDTGSFHQPILLPGAHQVTATALPSGTAEQLREMMHAVVTSPVGTAANVGFGPDVYAKTGTADHGAPGAAANSWLIAYDPQQDVALACVVLDGGFGAQSAASEAKAVFNAL